MQIWALTGIAVFCWTVFPLSAQTVRIRVEEADNGKPLSGVIIRAVKADGQTLRYGLTDQDGRVEMAMPESTDTLKVSLLGFRECTFVRPFQNQYLVRLETAPLSIRAGVRNELSAVGSSLACPRGRNAPLLPRWRTPECASCRSSGGKKHPRPSLK